MLTKITTLKGVEYGSSVLFSTNLSLFQVRCSAKSFFTLYFWLDPKVTKAQEPIKGDFAVGKPRTLFPLHAFIAGLTPFYFQSVFCIIEFSFHSILLSIPSIAIPLVAPPITADGFDLLFLNLFGGDAKISMF